MAAVQPRSSQQQAGSSRSQTSSIGIPLQKTAPPSTLQTPTPQSITPKSHTQPAPVPKPPTSSRIWTVPLTGAILACVALLVALIFGIGAWIGQAYGNTYARKSYELALWEMCFDHPVSMLRCVSTLMNIVSKSVQAIQDNELCYDRLRDGLHRSVKRDLGVIMQLGALSQVDKFRSNLVSWSICLLATTIWNSLHMNLTSVIRPIYFDRSYNATGQRWKQGLLASACIAVATTTTTSTAHILWYCFSSRTGPLGAVSFGLYGRSCLITCFGLILCRALLGVSYQYRMKPASKRSKSWSQTLYVILSTNNWFFIHEFLAQAKYNDIEVPLISDFLYFNLCLAAFAFLVHWPPSNPFEDCGVHLLGFKED